MKLFKSIVFAAIFALTNFITTAAASTPLDVTILSRMSTWPDGTFLASGPAVDSGLICESGTVTDVSGSTVGQQNPNLILKVHKHFDCADGSGSIEMDLNVRIAESGYTVRWLIVAGSGNYEFLFGEGEIQTAMIEGEIFDNYFGKLHWEPSISSPKDVIIVSDMSAWPNGTFEGSGQAVNTGLICPDGTVSDEFASTTGGQSSVLMAIVLCVSSVKIRVIFLIN